jgi:hypothetical protein
MKGSRRTSAVIRASGSGTRPSRACVLATVCGELIVWHDPRNAGMPGPGSRLRAPSSRRSVILPGGRQ